MCPTFYITYFQVVARERLINGQASAPVSLRVNVGDENDNAPILRPHPAITIQVRRDDHLLGGSLITL